MLDWLRQNRSSPLATAVNNTVRHYQPRLPMIRTQLAMFLASAEVRRVLFEQVDAQRLNLTWLSEEFITRALYHADGEDGIRETKRLSEDVVRTLWAVLRRECEAQDPGPGDERALLFRDNVLSGIAGLAKSLKERGPEGESLLHLARPQLSALEFEQELRAHEPLSGREWFVEIFTEWLHEPKSRLFFLTGAPGSGKSAVMAKLIRQSTGPYAVHLCTSRDRATLSAERFVSSIAKQLQERVPAYRTLLHEEQALYDLARDPIHFLEEHLLLPLAQIGEPVLLLIDGLDETVRPDQQGRLLLDTVTAIYRFSCNQATPWLRLVIGARDTPDIRKCFPVSATVTIRHLDTQNERNRIDLGEFIGAQMAKPPIAAQVEGLGTTREVMQSLIDKIADGNFLCARLLIDALANSDFSSLAELQQISPDLGDIYRVRFGHLFPDTSKYSNEVRPLLEILTVSHQPLSADQIATYVDRERLPALRRTPGDVEGALGQLAEFFPKRAGLYAAFHRSLVDWLHGIFTDPGPYRVDIYKGYQAIYPHEERRYRTGVRDRFTLYQLVLSGRMLQQIGHEIDSNVLQAAEHEIIDRFGMYRFRDLAGELTLANGPAVDGAQRASLEKRFATVLDLHEKCLDKSVFMERLVGAAKALQEHCRAQRDLQRIRSIIETIDGEYEHLLAWAKVPSAYLKSYLEHKVAAAEYFQETAYTDQVRPYLTRGYAQAAKLLAGLQQAHAIQTVRELLPSVSELGDYQYAVRHYMDARTTYDLCWQITEWLSQYEPDDLEVNYWIGACMFDRATCFDAYGNWTAAAELYDRAAEQFGRLTQVLPEDLGYCRAFSSALWEQGGSLSRANRAQEANAAFERSVAATKRAVELASDDLCSRILHTLYARLYTYADWLANAQRHEQAVETLERLFQVEERFSSEPMAGHEPWSHLQDGLRLLLKLRHSGEVTTSATDYLGKAVRIGKRLTEHDPQDATYAVWYVTALLALADAYGEAGSHPEAEEVAGQAIRAAAEIDSGELLFAQALLLGSRRSLSPGVAVQRIARAVGSMWRSMFQGVTVQANWEGPQ